MENKLKNTSLFFIGYLLLFVLAMIFFIYQQHGDFVLWLNSLRNPIWDFFFRYWTHTGDELFFVAVVGVVFYFNRRHGLVLAITGISVLLVSLFFKLILFPEVLRPIQHFQAEGILNLVEGVTAKDTHSFPSGHSMAAFALASHLALMIQRKDYSILFLVAAVLTGISRVYLLQHFLIDIMAGSLLGMILSVSCFMVFENYLGNVTKNERNSPDKDLEKMDLEI